MSTVNANNVAVSVNHRTKRRRRLVRSIERCLSDASGRSQLAKRVRDMTRDRMEQLREMEKEKKEKDGGQGVNGKRVSVLINCGDCGRIFLSAKSFDDHSDSEDSDCTIELGSVCLSVCFMPPKSINPLV